MIVAPSARKHGISDEDAVAAAKSVPIRVMPMKTSGERYECGNPHLSGGLRWCLSVHNVSGKYN